MKRLDPLNPEWNMTVKALVDTAAAMRAKALVDTAAADSSGVAP